MEIIVPYPYAQTTVARSEEPIGRRSSEDHKRGVGVWGLRLSQRSMEKFYERKI